MSYLFKKVLIILLIFIFSSCFGDVKKENAKNNIDFYTDVPLDHWAYGAVMELTKRGILEGYGNLNSRQYKGEKPLTRYQFAQALSKTIHRLEVEAGIKKPNYSQNIDIKKVFKESGLSEENIKLLSMLMEEFKKELADLNIRVTELETDKRKNDIKYKKMPIIFSILSSILGVLGIILAIIALII